LGNSSTSLKLKRIKSDDSIDEDSVAEEKTISESSSPSPDGVEERG